MSEKPILFSAPMVRAILAGTKTQTRRALPDGAWLDPELGVIRMCSVAPGVTGFQEVACRYGQPGTKLWVRETWQVSNWSEDGDPCIRLMADGSEHWPALTMEATDWALDTWAALSAPDNYNIDGRAADRRWRPSIHMPRWAGRITLEVVGVRVERLREISRGDAMAEGCPFPNMAAGDDPRQWYAALWDQINGAGSWDANPWVWVVEFRKVAP